MINQSQFFLAKRSDHVTLRDEHFFQPQNLRAKSDNFIQMRLLRRHENVFFQLFNFSFDSVTDSHIVIDNEIDQMI
ncbi:hypothetical protein D3C84_936590 [compost metagenome]